jgi:hypothetical protein
VLTYFPIQDYPLLAGGHTTVSTSSTGCFPEHQEEDTQ